jgi:hypothetical protein
MNLEDVLLQFCGEKRVLDEPLVSTQDANSNIYPQCALPFGNERKFVWQIVQMN